MKQSECCGAVDIGGTKISIGIVERSGTVLVKDTIPTPSAGDPLDTLGQVVSLLREQADRQSVSWEGLKGIGIGASGPVDYIEGVISNPYTLPGFMDFPIVEVLSGLTGLPVKIDNDVNVSLLGEIKLCKLQGRNAIFVAFGTGVGVSVWFSEGGLYRAGAGRYHPELGHIIVDNQGPVCYCTNRGCLEGTLSGKALNLGARERGYADFDYLYRAALEGEPKAVSYIALCEERLHRAFWTLLTVFKPEIVYLGGGLVDTYYDFFSNAISSRISPVFGFFNSYELRKARKDHESAISGASALIFGMN